MVKKYTDIRGIASNRQKVLLVYGFLGIAPILTLSPELVAQTSTKVQTVKSAKYISVKGQVRDSDGEPLVGVSIKIQGTSSGVATDAKGHFVLPSVSPTAVLEISYVGMQKQVIKLAGRTQLSIKMQSDGQLEQVVVTGYQQIKRERMTGAVATLRSSDFKNLDIKSVDQILKGTVAGVQAVATGRPGEDARIRIRGTNTLSGNASPIWIIDGMPLQGEAPDVKLSNDLDAMLYQTGIGNISPDDIESINVLKDAAASAIYGARAANGVIVITTKRGKEGPTRVNVTTHFGLSERPSSGVQMMNTAQKIRFERELYNDWGFAVTTYGRVAELLSRVDRGVLSQAEAEGQIANLSQINTNWFNELYRPAWSTQVNMSLNGGSKRTQHYTTLNLTNEQGTEPNNVYRRLYISNKLDHSLTDHLRLQTNLSATYRTNQSHAASFDPLNYALYANPYEQADGFDLSWTMAYSRTQAGYLFPTFNAKQELRNNTNFSKYLEASLSPRLEWDTPLQGLKLIGQGIVTASASNTQTELAEGGHANYVGNWLQRHWLYPDLPLKIARGSLSERSYTRTSYTVKALADYERTFAERHNWHLLAGAEASHSVSYGTNVFFPVYDKAHRVVGYPELVEGVDLREIPFSRLGGTSRFERKLASLFFNASYSYKDRYAVSSSIRYDGSDVIGNENQFTPLWNISGRWNLHQEPWFKVDWLNFLSLRLGYGLTGSIDRSALPYVLMTFTDSDIYDGVTTPTSFSYANPSIRWQTKKDFNIGLDASLLNDRLRLGLNYYYNQVIDLLDRRGRPYSSGVSSIVQNVSSLLNKGWEIDLAGDIVRSNKFTWSVRGNLALNTNVVTKTFHDSLETVPRGYNSKDERLIVTGYPQSAVFAYRFRGVDPTTGHTLGLDDEGKDFDMDNLLNKTKKLTAPMISYIGPSEPPIIGGFSTSFRYDRWVLDASFEFMAGHYIKSFNFNSYLGSGNRHITDQGRWRVPGDEASRPALTYSNSAYNTYPFDVNYERGDYLRASYVTLGYNVPSKAVKKLGLQALRLSLTGNNLFTFTRYRGIDPSLMGRIGYPNSRKYSLSINLSF